MDAAIEQTTSRGETPNNVVESENKTVSAMENNCHDIEQPKEQIQETDKEHVRSGRKGFKFGRLKEDPVIFSNHSPDTTDSVLVIGNPAYQEGPKKAGCLEQKVDDGQSIQSHHLSEENCRVNGFSSAVKDQDISEGDDEIFSGNQEVLNDEESLANGHPLEDR